MMHLMQEVMFLARKVMYLIEVAYLDSAGNTFNPARVVPDSLYDISDALNDLSNFMTNIFHSGYDVFLQ